MPFKSSNARKAFFEGLKQKQGIGTPGIKPPMGIKPMTGTMSPAPAMPSMPKPAMATIPGSTGLPTRFPMLKKRLGGAMY